MHKDPNKIRNIVIIAHVDHGKTTLVDGLLKQSNTFRQNQSEMNQTLIMDSGDQERERGITITAKITSVNYDGFRINIIDTPGHADFSGEVERTINMADGCLLVVDALEGPMPQTHFVLSKAMANNLPVIVIINKIDKNGARTTEIKNELDDLFLELATDEKQLHYPIYYAVAREGKAWQTLPEDFNQLSDLSVIFKAIIKDIPPPKVDLNKPFQMLVSALAYDSYQGKYAIGRISRGSISNNQPVILCKNDGSQIKSRVDKVYMNQGLVRFDVTKAIAGDVVSLSGISEVAIGDTIADYEKPEALPSIDIESPTLQIYLGPNTSPFKGQSGKFLTSRQIGERLYKELETNVALKVEPNGIGFRVSGRGELHLSVLIEAMRREGYEFEVGRPMVITKKDNNQELEPIEEVVIDVPIDYVGQVQTELGQRRAELQKQFHSSSKNLTNLVYLLPTRNLLGIRSNLMTLTKGTALINSRIVGFKPLGQALSQLRNGVIIAYETGETTAYSLQNAEARGLLFVNPAEKVYKGQIVGITNRREDIEVNVCKGKHLTNMRSSSSDGVVQLSPPKKMSLEECLDFIENDELLEVTPESLRLRKSELDSTLRKRQNK